MYIERRYRRPSQDFLAARSMTKKRLSLILIMESSRFVIEKKKTLLSLSTQRPRSRDDALAARRPHAPHDRPRAGLEDDFRPPYPENLMNRR